MTERRLPGWLDPERRVVLGIALAALALHLSFAARYGWFRDELYYVACGQRLAWGYVDHPPVIAVVARVVRLFAGDSVVALRAVTALSGSATVVIGGELARTLGGGRTAQALAALGIALAPYDLAVAQLYTMNGFEPLFWSAAGLAVARAIRTDEPKELLWLGPVFGIGVLNKHSVVWVAGALTLAIAISPSRRLLARKETWIAAAVAAAIVVPHAIWQASNGWPTREFMRSALSGKNIPYTPLGFLKQQIELMHPFGFPLWSAGLVGLLGTRTLRPFRPLGVAWMLIAALLIVTQAKAYYLGPAYPWLFAAGGVVAERATDGDRWRWARVVYPALLVLGALALLPMTVPVLPVPLFQRYFAAMGGIGEAKSGEIGRRGALPQLYADMHGWPEMAAQVADVVDGLPERERAGATILAKNYGEASAIEILGKARRVPRVGSGNNGWWLWGPPDPAPHVVIAVGDFDRDRLAEIFTDVVEVARFDHPLARPNERDIPIRVCRAPRIPLADAWPRLKDYK